MVVPFSYGKHCEGFAPGQPAGVDVASCPDREDCENVNGDAILMAGYLCHPCIPNMCGTEECGNLPAKGFTCLAPGEELTICSSACAGACAGSCHGGEIGCLNDC